MTKSIITVCSFFAVYAVLTSYDGVPIDHDHALVFIIAHEKSVNDANNYAGITQKNGRYGAANRAISDTSQGMSENLRVIQNSTR